MPITRLGPLQKGSIDSQEFAIYSFRGGINVKDVPQDISDQDLTSAFNVYLTTAGGIRMRNGISKHGSVMTGSGPVLGLARFYQNINGGSVVNPQTVKLLAQVGGNLRVQDTNTLIGSIGGTSANPMTWVRAQDPNHSGGLTDVMVICTGANGPYLYDGSTLTTPAGWAAASGASWCALINGIVYFGGIPSQPRQVMGTGDGIITSFETLDPRFIFTVSNPVSGLCAMGSGSTAALVVGQSSGLTIIYGTGPGNFVQQDVPSFNDGVIAGRAMISEGGVCYFLGRQAIYSFDGTSEPQQISIKIEPWVLNDPYIPGYPLAGPSSLCSMFIHDNRLHLIYSITSTATAPETILCYDLVLKGWTVIQATPGVYCAASLDASSDPSPAQVVVGSNATPQVYNWDIAPGVGTVATDDGSAITALFQTKYFKIGVPGTIKSVSRVYPEYFLSGPFVASWLTQTDYGNLTSSSISVSKTPAAGMQWDVNNWDIGFWASTTDFTSFNAPASRIDLDEIQGDSFSFGVSSTGNCAPWILAGITGVFKQRGRY